MRPELVLRTMTRSEVDELVEWAALEGWNPGLHDAGTFWATDPEAFIAGELSGKLIAGGAITAYGTGFGFMGLFIVRPEYRGKGYGNTLWLARRDSLKARLNYGATLGMDGVFEMEPYYAKGGFVRSHRHLRYVGKSTSMVACFNGQGIKIMPIHEVPFQQVLEYDRRCFPVAREKFLRAWLAIPESLALGALRNGRLCGYGVIRHCRTGCRVGPLFADDLATAQALLNELWAFGAGQLIHLDVPDNNPEAMELAQALGMEEVFGCARMYLGPFPGIDYKRVFGITTLELG